MTTTPKVWRATQQANLTDAGDQSDPHIVDIGSDRYVVVWTEAAGGPIATTPGSDLVGQIFDARGNRIGTEFRANVSFFADNEQNAELDTRPGGGFVMVYSDTDAAGTSIRAQSYDVNGSLVGGAPTTIQADTNTDTLSSAGVAVRSNGSYLVTYARSTEAGGPLSTSTVGRIVSAAGAVGAEFTIADAAVVGPTFNPDVDVLSNGNYVVVYEHQPGFSDFAAAYQIRDSTGGFVRGGDFGGPLAFDVHVAALTGGSFVVVWTEEDGDAPVGGSGTGIAARVDNGAGAPATFLIVNTSVAGGQVRPDVAPLNDGGFVVTWFDNNLGLLRGQRFDAAGTKVGVEFTAGDMGSEANPLVASLGDGRFAVGFAQVSGDDDIWATLFDPRTSPTVNFPSPFCDFDDDGKSGVLWRHDSGQVYFWEMNGLAIKAEGGVAHAPVPNDWHIQGAGDFDGDGNNDVLWRHDSGQVYFWEMNGLAIKAEGGVAHAPVPNDWHIQGTVDFDGDGKSDILWRHDSGQVYFWEMDGLAIKAEGGAAHAPVPNDWHIQGTGDFDGDGKSDILWRHDSGQVYFWEMDGLTIKAEGGVAHAPVPNDWHIQGVGDFDGDGNSDILWRHDSGQVYIWEMNGLAIKAEGGVAHALVPNDWHIQDIGDYNGDGKSDILWRHDSGQVYFWEMNGLGITAEGGVAHAPVPGDWHIFSPNNFV
jgi:FG-GAP-like repeat